MKCTALLEHRIETNDRDYLNSGNVLLDRLFDCAIEYRQCGLDMNAEAEAKGDALRAAGEKAYVIPGGGSNTGRRAGLRLLRAGTGAAGRRDGAADRPHGDRHRQRRHPGRPGGRAGGLNAGIPVLGIGVRLPKDRQEANVHRLAEATADYVGVRGGIPRSAVEANCDYVGAGYGQPTRGMIEAVLMLARLEGVLLDPVYSGKAMAGLIDLIRKGEIPQERDGGVPAHRRRGRVVRLYRVFEQAMA